MSAAAAKRDGARKPKRTPDPPPMPEPRSPSALEPICSLPLVGATTVEDAVFYAAVGVVGLFGFVSWPTAALVGGGHALHQRARNVVRAGTFAEAREGVMEAIEDVL